MEDDDIADNAQNLLDALDMFLQDPRVADQVDADDLNLIRIRRRLVVDTLAAYRAKSGFTQKRASGPVLVPSGPRRGTVVRVAMASTLAIPATYFGTGVATGTGAGAVGARLAVSDVLAPLAFIAFFSQLTDEPPAPTAAQHARYLTNAVSDLLRDLLDLDQINSILEMTAAEATALSTDELLEKLVNAINVTAGAVVVDKIVAELIKRFPACVAHIRLVADKYKYLHRIKKNPSLFGSRAATQLTKLLGEINDALKALQGCMRLGPPAAKGKT